MNRLCSILIALALPAAAFADAVKLTTGELVEGKVVASDAESITIEVQFSPTITDERRIPRAQIAGTAIASPDEVAFTRIQKLGIPATALDSRPYDEILEKDLRPFLKKFPASTRATDVRALVKTCEQDRARLLAGEVKVADVWYDAPTAVAEKYQIEAAAALVAMSQQIAAQNYPAAMNYFDLLLRTYPASTAFAEAAPLGDKALQKLSQQLTFTLANLPGTRARRQAAIDQTPPEQRVVVEKAVAAEDARAAALADAAQRANRKFFPIVPYDEKGLTSMLDASRKLAEELQTIDQKQLVRGAQLVRQAQNELARNELAGLTTTLTELKSVWPAYEGTARLEQRLQAAKTATTVSSEREAKHLGAQKVAPADAR